MNVEGRAAIVTGGGTGVGRATSLALAERGCDVLVPYSSGRWLRGGLGEATYEALKRGAETRAPLHKICEPEDVSAAILSLIEGSDLVTGQVLAVDGGTIGG